MAKVINFSIIDFPDHLYVVGRTKEDTVRAVIQDIGKRFAYYSARYVGEKNPDYFATYSEAALAFNQEVAEVCTYLAELKKIMWNPTTRPLPTKELKYYLAPVDEQYV